MVGFEREVIMAVGNRRKAVGSGRWPPTADCLLLSGFLKFPPEHFHRRRVNKSEADFAHRRVGTYGGIEVERSLNRNQRGALDRESEDAGAGGGGGDRAKALRVG